MSVRRGIHRPQPAPEDRGAVPSRIDVTDSIFGFRSGPAVNRRAGAAWVGACAVGITGMALFILNQNLRTADVSFLVWRGQFPLAVVMLASALLGAGLTLVLGSPHILRSTRSAQQDAGASARAASRLT